MGKGGLQGVVVADITSSLVDGENGRLIYEGYEIEDLAANALFEDVAFLLWHHRLPKAHELEELRLQIATEAALPQSIIDLMKSLPKDAVPMAVLRTVVSALAHYDPDSENMDKGCCAEEGCSTDGANHDDLCCMGSHPQRS
jgi:citrate synthase